MNDLGYEALDRFAAALLSAIERCNTDIAACDKLSKSDAQTPETREYFARQAKEIVAAKTELRVLHRSYFMAARAALTNGESDE